MFDVGIPFWQILAKFVVTQSLSSQSVYVAKFQEPEYTNLVVSDN